MSSQEDPAHDATGDYGESSGGGGDSLTWGVLLGRWVEFARGALALPEDGAGRAMRESVADIIALQAVWFALQHIDELDRDERALGIARAEVLIERHARAVTVRWRGEPMPKELRSLIDDAREALAKSRQD
ncbi:MAG: hypothetical protein R3C45_02445 [Phycisphaerales bacterium]